MKKVRLCVWVEDALVAKLRQLIKRKDRKYGGLSYYIQKGIELILEKEREGGKN